MSMLCVNIPKGNRRVYYHGNEATPLGLGFSPRFEKIGRVRQGNSGFMYVIAHDCAQTKRWFKVRVDRILGVIPFRLGTDRM
jgi:hypothetical protein